MVTPAEVRPTLPDVLRDVFVDFPTFAREWLNAPRPPVFLLAAWIVGMDVVAGVIELEYVTQGAYLVDDWFHAWLRIFVGGALAGAIRYWFAGSMFHVLGHLAGARMSARTSRYALLYASLPVAVIDLAVKILEMIGYRNAYFTGQTHSFVDGVVTAAMLGAWIFTARLCLVSLRVLGRAPAVRSLVVLLAAGVILFLLASFSALM